MADPDLEWLLKRPVNHLGYFVKDIPSAVESWAKLGIGPFVYIENVVFDSVTRNGEPCVFDHSAAFAWLGTHGLELQEITDAQPTELARELGVGDHDKLNHIAWTSSDPAADGRRLAESGFAQSVDCLAGPISDQMHYVPALGHAIEIHVDSEALAGFWAGIKASSEGWDGSEPLRSMAVSEL